MGLTGPQRELMEQHFQRWDITGLAVGVVGFEL